MHHRPVVIRPCAEGCGRNARPRALRCAHCKPGETVPMCSVSACTGPGVLTDGRCRRHRNWLPPCPECAHEGCAARARAGTDFCGWHRRRP
jgi:hypothetical protein